MNFLRYIGGKTRGRHIITRYIPEDVSEICSPFLGGGAIELALAERGVQIHGYDVFEPLVNCWQQVKRDATAVADAAREHFPLGREEFYCLQGSYWQITDPVAQAGAFFAINRASFSGLTFSGGYSGTDNRFTESSIRKLKTVTLPHIAIDVADYESSLARHPDAFVYADPPYLLPPAKASLYGVRGDAHRNFSHDRLAEILRERPGRWLLSYNNHETVRSLYRGFPMVATTWAYGSSRNSGNSELLILSHELAESLGLGVLGQPITAVPTVQGAGISRVA